MAKVKTSNNGWTDYDKMPKEYVFTDEVVSDIGAAFWAMTYGHHEDCKCRSCQAYGVFSNTVEMTRRKAGAMGEYPIH